MGGFSALETLCGFKAGPSSDLWALGCIIYEIRAGTHLFPLAIKISPFDAIFEIMHVLGSLPSHLSHTKFDGHGFPNPSGETIVPNKPVEDPLCQVVAEIEVEPKANPEDALTETRGLEEAPTNGRDHVC